MPDLENPADPGDTAKVKAVLLVCATAAFAAAPLMTQPFTGFDPDQFPNPTGPLPLQPAGYAFALWGVIYVWLLVSAGYGLFKRDTDRGWDATRWPLFISTGIGASWLGVALLNPLIATVLIFAMLAGALVALLRAPRRDSWWCAAPIGLYAGWLTAASFVAGATTLTGWTGLSATTSSWIGLLAIGGLGIGVLRQGVPVTYAAALIWALVGVGVATLGADPANMVFAGGVLGAIVAVAWAAWTGAAAQRA